MDLNNGDNICIKEVNENLKRVMNDQPLTRPLSQLRNNCNFVKLYNEYFDVINEDKIKERLKVSRKKYNQKPEVKERLKKYYLLNRATISIKRKEKYLKDKQPTKEVKGATQ